MSNQISVGDTDENGGGDVDAESVVEPASGARSESSFASEIRPLTAEEYIELLTNGDVELRISDGTAENTWRFWMDDGTLLYRRLTWTENKVCGPPLLESVLDDGGTTQMVKPVGE